MATTRTDRPSRPDRPDALGFPDRALRIVLLVVVVAVAAGLFALALLPTFGTAGRGVQRFADRLNAIGTDIEIRLPKVPERSTIYAADGSVLATLFLEENRKWTPLGRVNDVTRQAVLAIEDARFYDHSGLDYRGIIRALFRNVRSGEILQGASTLTQQLARNAFEDIGKERTLERKIAEARVAMRLEEEHSKDEILEFYLNEVYFGRSVFGVGTAAEFYFGKSASKLTLPEAATLAGLIAAPERFSPVVNPEAALERRNIVINRMADIGYISEEEAAQARSSPLELNQRVPTSRQKFPFFVEFVKREILDLANKAFNPLGKTLRQRQRALFQGGLKIYTTLEPELQRAGEEIANRHLPDPGDPENAIASVDAKTGAVRALVVSEKFRQSQVNLATGQGGSGRQAGSAFKPFTLVAAFEQGIPPEALYNGSSGQIVNCTPYGPSDYRAVNADGSARGFINLWEATRGSVNAVFVQLAVDAGPNNVVEAANRMGIQSALPEVCSITLGTGEVSPLEMASAYQTLANEGVHCRPFGIRRVEDRNGKAVVKQKKGSCKEVVDPAIANLTVNLLRGVVTGGTGTRAALPNWPVFGKTGSTNNLADAWFAGCTRQICTSSWVGHPEGLIAMSNVHGVRVFGGTFPAQIWHDFMMIAMRGRPAEAFPGVPSIAWPVAKVPDVIGLPQEEAQRILGQAGFSVLVERVPSLEEEGIVVGQSHGGGSEVTKGTRITISVSNGRAPKVKVPNVIGMTEGKAIQTLQKAGLSVNVSSAPTSDQAQGGLVAAQSPGAGVKAKAGATVSITVLEFKKPKEKPPPSPAPSPIPTPTA